MCGAPSTTGRRVVTSVTPLHVARIRINYAGDAELAGGRAHFLRVVGHGPTGDFNCSLELSGSWRTQSSVIYEGLSPGGSYHAMIYYEDTSITPSSVAFTMPPASAWSDTTAPTLENPYLAPWGWGSAFVRVRDDGGTKMLQWFMGTSTTPWATSSFFGGDALTTPDGAGFIFARVELPANATGAIDVRVRATDWLAHVSEITTTLVITTTNASLAEDEVLYLVNARRAAGANCGSAGTFGPAPALTENSPLTNAARGHSLDMATNDFFSHVSSDGRTLTDRVRAAGYTGGYLGENITAGTITDTPAEAVAQWMNSPPHCAAIMNATYRQAGVGYAYSAASTYDHYWTLDFGAP